MPTDVRAVLDNYGQAAMRCEGIRSGRTAPVTSSGSGASAEMGVQTAGVRGTAGGDEASGFGREDWENP